MVPEAGLEPAHPQRRGILNPLRLPISPLWLISCWLLSVAAYITVEILAVNTLCEFYFIQFLGNLRDLIFPCVPKLSGARTFLACLYFLQVTALHENQ